MLIASISGIRGTLGKTVGQDLTENDVIAFVSAFAILMKGKGRSKVVVGRDARASGRWITKIVIDVLTERGISVVDLDLATTPTIEMAVVKEKAVGGIIISASHNPIEWNGLKFLNAKGEIVDETQGKKILELYRQPKSSKEKKSKKGKVTAKKNYEDFHIRKILELPLVHAKNVKQKNFTVVVDGINSTGGIVMPKLLRRLGVKKIISLNAKPTGKFAHTPEPLPQNLTGLAHAVCKHKADLGIAVDPDVDRLVFFDEKGNCFGEEYTIVAIADYVLSHTPGNTVSNLSSSRALADVTKSLGGKYSASPVGLMHVIREMKKTRAIFGGEGNGGVVYPRLHYGRDALVGTALFLSYIAEANAPVSQLRSRYPKYEMAKEKLALAHMDDAEKIFLRIKKIAKGGKIDTRDGVKIDFPDSWVHIRRSNTEPLVRIYTEAPTKTRAEALAGEWKRKLNSLL